MLKKGMLQAQENAWKGKGQRQEGEEGGGILPEDEKIERDREK